MAYQLPYGAAVAYVAIPGGAVGVVPSAAIPYYAPGYVPANPAAYSAFQSVDADRSGAIDWKELRVALGSAFGDSSFPGSVARLLVRLYDADRSGSLQYPEFEQLYGKLMQWREFFFSTNHMDDGRGAYITRRDMETLMPKLGIPLNDEIKGILLESLTPDDGADRVTFPVFIRMCAEIEALAKFVQTCDRSNGNSVVSMSPFKLIAGFYTCHG